MPTPGSNYTSTNSPASFQNFIYSPSTPGGYCGGYYGPDVRRGVFLEDFVYSISYGGVVVKDSRNLAAAGKSLPLSSPTVDPSYGGGCAVASNDGGF